MSERGIEDGFADVVEHFAANMQTEAFESADRRQGPTREQGRE
jgi:hypothetical protein